MRLDLGSHALFMFTACACLHVCARSRTHGQRPVAAGALVGGQAQPLSLVASELDRTPYAAVAVRSCGEAV